MATLKKKNYILTRYKRTPQQREADLALIAAWYLRGYNQTQIAERLGKERPYKLSGKTISEELQELHNRWLASSLIDINTAKHQELERLRLLEQEYWEGWRSSRDARLEVETDEINDEQGKDSTQMYSRKRTKTKNILRDGEAKFLEGIERCIRLRCEILGLYQPKQVNVGKIDWQAAADDAGIPESVVNQQFEELVATYTSAMEKSQDDK